jgi:acetolactate decarboxylase
VTVRWVGAQRDVLGGDVEGKLSLRTIAHRPHLYGLGPRAGVSGEITIFDGVPSVATVVDGQVSVVASFDHDACFLVWAEVAAWIETRQPDAIHGELALERAVLGAAQAASFDPLQPLVFLVRAPAADVTFHVLAKRDGLPHTPALHERAKVRFAVTGQAVEILGFCSSEHHGIFTPRDSNLHMHLRTADGRMSGHVESLSVAPGAVIAVPARRAR